jgi:type IV secretory pathway VirB2 component (pilin)
VLFQEVIGRWAFSASTFAPYPDELESDGGANMKMLHRIARVKRPELRPSFSGFLLLTLLLFPLAAHAQSGSSPFDTGLTSIQTLFTGTIAKVSSLIAIVLGGYAFAHGEPGAKKTLAGVAAGTGIAVMATNILTWLWGS